MRLIDADKLTAVFKFLCEQKNVDTITIEAVEAIIDTAPTVSQWIPCSRELPKEDGLYRVTIHPDYLTPQMVQTDDFYWENGKWKFWEVKPLELVLHEVDVEVIAWKPLEEPYQEP